MREIKFRAWDKLNKEMTDFNLFERPTACYGKEVEIMQYTGLKDKNGKEIYEGDIVEYEYDRFGSEQSITENKVIKNAFKAYEWLVPMVDDELIEVIGNVHENPELLN